MSTDTPDDRDASSDHPPLRDDLTGFQRDLLFTIAHEGGHPGAPARHLPIGSDIKVALGEAYDGQPITHSQHYQSLRDLVEKGLVAEGVRDGRAKTYQLTDEGVAVCERRVDWILAVAMRERDRVRRQDGERE